MSKNDPFYHKHAEKPFPQKIYWKIIKDGYDKHGKIKKLSVLQEYDIIFDEHDLNIRKLKLEDLKISG